MTSPAAWLPFNLDCLRGAFVPAKRGAVPAGMRGHWVIVQDQHLVVPDAPRATLPAGAAPDWLPAEPAPLFLGTWEGTPCWVASLPREATLSPGFRRETLVPMRGVRLPDDLLSLGGMAMQALWWQSTSGHCPRCGAPTERLPGEWGKRCPRCRYEHFPHDADIGVRGFGASEAEAFEQAALAMTAEDDAGRPGGRGGRDRVAAGQDEAFAGGTRADRDARRRTRDAAIGLLERHLNRRGKDPLYGILRGRFRPPVDRTAGCRQKDRGAEHHAGEPSEPNDPCKHARSIILGFPRPRNPFPALAGQHGAAPDGVRLTVAW